MSMQLYQLVGNYIRKNLPFSSYFWFRISVSLACMCIIAFGGSVFAQSQVVFTGLQVSQNLVLQQPTTGGQVQIYQ